MGPARFEPPSESIEKRQVSTERGTNSRTDDVGSGFADAVAAVMRLPLSEVGKVEAVRRLLR
jgi:hypothetical protein